MSDTHGLETLWPAGPEALELGPAGVDVWRISLAVDNDRLQHDTGLLSPSEQQRAKRYRVDVHRHRFIVRRAALRTILSRYLDAAPNELSFETNTHGKPHLATPSDVRFNASHSGSLGLVGVARGRELGIDIERLDRKVELIRLARRFFSSAEAEIIARFQGAAAVAAFFACWTRKEAYVKARGVGLTMGLESFEVSIDPLEPAALLRSDDDPANTRRWWMAHLAPSAEYFGAIAAEGPKLAIRHWQLGNRDP